ncbi:UNVERIFIED_CONTAM: CocE/NonD family hydrolase, partial [Salmonella enterica subsp. enterica serovar Weltevreden]
TGYNKSIPAIPAVNPFLVRHGYAHLSVDVRGTGLSGGDWEAFSEREQQDYREIMDWIVAQPWSNGRVGTWGASFMGITQLFTAAHQ